MRWFWQKRDNTNELPQHLQAGIWGEAQAEKHLKRKGYRILGRRVKVGAKDEIDLLARQDNVLVFVEVKTRESEDFGRPISAIHRDKRRALSRAAIHYLHKLREKPPYFRFDVVEVVGTPAAEDPVVRHIENAFPMAGGYRITW